MAVPIVYTLSTCPTCEDLRADWMHRGIPFEERQVDENQSWLDEALGYDDTVPIVVYENGRVEIGFKGEVG